MKLILRYANSMVTSVENMSRYLEKSEKSKTEEAVVAQIELMNSRNSDVVYKLVEVPDNKDIEEAFDMLLGQKKYKHASDIEDLCTSLDNLRSVLEDLESDVSDALSPVEEILEDIKDILEDE